MTIALAISLQEHLPEVAIVVGVAALGILLLLAMRSRGEMAGGAAPPPSRPGASSGSAQDAADEIARAALQLEFKAERLHQLIAVADERIATLAEFTSVVDGAPRPRQREQPSPPIIDPLTRNVYELADAGQTHVEIAQSLQEQVGKVQLILALRGG